MADTMPSEPLAMLDDRPNAGKGHLGRQQRALPSMFMKIAIISRCYSFY